MAPGSRLILSLFQLLVRYSQRPSHAVLLPSCTLTDQFRFCARLFRGIVNTFGVFQTYYESNLLSSQSPSNISWIGAIQAFLLLIIGVATGPVYDAGYLRTLLLLGSFLTIFGMMMLSIATDYWQVMLAQALCVGLGSGCLFIPSVAIVATYFTTKKSFATGIAASGSSLGASLHPSHVPRHAKPS